MIKVRGLLASHVVSAFPGTGKSHLATGGGGIILDSDSSAYSWLSKGVRNPDFPANYVAHIRENIDRANLILVSSHAEVRAALVDAGINFALAYPALELKDEYIARYRRRGSPQAFIDLIDAKWDEWIGELASQQGACHVVLKSGQYLSDLYG